MSRGVAYLQELLVKLHEAERATAAHCAKLDGSPQLTPEEGRAWDAQYDRLEMIERRARYCVVSALELMLQCGDIVDPRQQRPRDRAGSRKTRDR